MQAGLVGAGGRDYECTISLTELLNSEWVPQGGGWKITTKRGEVLYVGPRQYRKLFSLRALELQRVNGSYRLALSRDLLGFVREVGGRRFIFRFATRDYVPINIDELKREVKEALEGEGFTKDEEGSLDAFDWGARYVNELWLGSQLRTRVGGLVRVGLSWRIGDDGTTGFHALMMWFFLACGNGVVEARARAFHIGTLVKQRIQWLLKDLIRRITPLNVFEEEIETLMGVSLPTVGVEQIARRYGRFGNAITRRLSVEAGAYGWNAYALLQSLAWLYTHIDEVTNGIVDRLEGMDYVGNEITKLRSDPEEYVTQLAKE